ncbi:MAG: hypothetical protein CL482_16495 [Acidobacteria bacterium]|jgi:hypothetical protein|nr:hypothetical protein [Acidobacteriota bacterium]
MDDGPEQRRGSFVKSGAIALVLSVVANLLVRAGASALFDIPPEFPPLQGAGPVVFFSVIGVLAALGVFAGIGGVSSRPVPVFRIVAGVVLVVSFIPDLWLLTESGAASFPGATPAGVGTLMLMHVVSAAAVVWAVERSG